MNIFDGLINYLGYEYPLDEDDRMKGTLRFLTLKWACKFGHAGCRKAANTKLIDHFGWLRAM